MLYHYTYIPAIESILKEAMPQKDGVVLEVDDSVFVPNQELTMMMSKRCLAFGSRRSGTSLAARENAAARR